MILLMHIYLQWNSLIEILAKKESGLSSVHQDQMFISFPIRSRLRIERVDISFSETIIERLRDPLLLGSSTILAASKMFCHATNPHLHDKVRFI